MKHTWHVVLIFFLFILAAVLIIYNPSLQDNQGFMGNQINPVLSIMNRADSTVSFRGISTVDDSVIWVSGSKSTMGRSLDFGKTWNFYRFQPIDSLQFRDIQAFSHTHAVAMSAGYPTRIVHTRDGGFTWSVAYANDDERLFLDGMAFWNDGSGMAYGDPIAGNWTLLHTSDYSAGWYVDSSMALPATDGEAGFAASGTGIVCTDDSLVMFGSGGAAAHLYVSRDRGQTWKIHSSPLLAGLPSQGIFSLSNRSDFTLLVGGDYANDTANTGTVAGYNFDDQSWIEGQGLPYQSAVQFISDSLAIAVGTTGCYYTLNTGKNWIRFSDESMHTLSEPTRGNVLYCAGANGRIAKIVLAEQPN
jgi:photosystem II stability/assembly factor-like uncharacterized protein